MTESMKRELSIVLIEHLRIMPTPKRGGDWKDDLEEFSYRLPSHKELEGITEEEYGMLCQGDSCPRACSELLSDLFEELEGDLSARAITYRRKLETTREHMKSHLKHYEGYAKQYKYK
jgi:hypothetical protein